MMKRELKNKNTIKYLEEILSREAYICNPSKLEIPGFGKVTATSMVDYHIYDGNAIPYFNFKGNGKTGEFFREGKKYFVEYNGRIR